MIPALVQWELTDRCNFGCLHCYHVNPKDNKKIFHQLDENDMWSIAEVIAKNKLFFVTFTGGEPLLRKKLLIEISKYLFANNLILSLNTNLLLLDEEIITDLKVHRMLVSCPSTDAFVYKEITGNGDYDLFESKLKMLIESGIKHTVNMVVTKKNCNLVKETATRLAKLGVTHFAATPASINAYSPNFSLLLDLQEVKQVISDLVWVYENLGLNVDIMESIPKCIMPKKAFELELPFIYRYCSAGRRNGTISSVGNIRPCSHNPMVFGNILKQDMGEIWEEMQHWRTESDNAHMDCLGCDMFTNNCGGGCRVDAETRVGQVNANHPYMPENVSNIKVKPKKITLTPESIIRPSKLVFQSRPENEGWLVSPGFSRDILQVNEMVYKFLVATRKLNSMSIKMLAEKFNVFFDDENFQKIIKILVRKHFFIIE